MNLEEVVPERFVVRYDKESGIFRILDTWHESIKNLNLDENPNIPENSPALKNLTTEEVNAVVGELIKMGWLDKLIESKVNSPTKIIERSKDIKDLIVEKIAEITLDDRAKPEQHTSVSKDAISALKEIASKL